MTTPSNTQTPSLRQWWSRVLQWLWRALSLFWGTILFGLILNIGATWLTTPLKNIDLNDTLLGWLIHHPLVIGPIGISLLILTIIVGVTYYLMTEQISLSRSEIVDRQDRERFLTKLDFRYSETFEQYLRDSALITLQLSKKPDAVYNPSREVFRPPKQPERALPVGTSILKVYDDAGGEILILGQPGAGKTVLLIELAQQLLKRAQNDENHPLPLVFHLSTWANKRQPLADWLVEELAISYQVPRHLGQTWVNTNQILPLLDGLDEVNSTYRTDCIEAINVYRQNNLLSLVVCSRSNEYLSQKSQLALHNAVVIEPLTKPQVDKYLLHAGKPLAVVRAALRKNAPLQELVTTPFMLSILVFSYRGKLAKDLPKIGSANLQQQVIEHYIVRAFEHKGEKFPYSQQKTIYWLTWLAKQMRTHNQTEFYIEQLQMDWYPATRFSRLYPSILVGIVMGIFGWFVYGLFYGSHIGLLYGIVDGFFIGCCATLLYSIVNGFVLDWLEEIKRRNQVNTGSWLKWVQLLPVNFLTSKLGYGLIFGITIGPLVGLLIGIVKGPASGIGYGLYDILVLTLDFVFFGKLEKEIHPAEVVSWSWIRARRVVVRFAVGGIVVGLALGLLFVDILNPLATILLGLLFALGFEVIIGLIGGFSHEKLDRQKLMRPNQGIRRSLQNSISFGMLGFCTGGLIFGLIFTITENPINGLLAGVSAGTTLGQIIGLRGGGFACLQHVVLRFLLWRSGYAPWNYPHFLDDAAELILLHKVGGGYTFVHHLLLDYFASLNL